LTDDNPRGEDPDEIRAQIREGLHEARIYEIPDRAQAIREAVAHLGSRDILAIAGKGHEKFQWTAEGSIPFDDCLVAMKACQEIFSGQR
jgi:UDP-N-acetylmuramoyl-L-alanyl-D-glutamate--2,6-diaminopimelate ligase